MASATVDQPIGRPDTLPTETMSAKTSTNKRAVGDAIKEDEYPTETIMERSDIVRR